MSKGVCPHCHQAVDVNLSENIETCLHCQKEYLPRQAHKLFELLYSQYSSNGNIALNISRNYAKAFDEYQKLLAIDGDSIDAIFGLASSIISLAKIDENVVEKVISLMDSKIQKIMENIELYAEIARNFIALGSRFDVFLAEGKQRLMSEDRLIDEGAKSRYIELVSSALSLWEYINEVFNNHFEDYGEERSLIQQRISNLKNEAQSINNFEVLSPGDEQYFKLKDSTVFESRMGLFKWRVILAVMQIVFVIGAIIGFSIMMSNYENNPFPGLIVFGSFALLFAIANIMGRILKNKLSK